MGERSGPAPPVWGLRTPTGACPRGAPGLWRRLARACTPRVGASGGPRGGGTPPFEASGGHRGGGSPPRWRPLEAPGEGGPPPLSRPLEATEEGVDTLRAGVRRPPGGGRHTPGRGPEAPGSGSTHAEGGPEAPGRGSTHSGHGSGGPGEGVDTRRGGSGGPPGGGRHPPAGVQGEIRDGWSSARDAAEVPLVPRRDRVAGRRAPHRGAPRDGSGDGSGCSRRTGPTSTR